MELAINKNIKCQFIEITDGTNDILFGVYQPIRMMKEYPCTISSVPIDYRKLGNGMVFQRNWAYSKLINFHLLKVSCL